MLNTSRPAPRISRVSRPLRDALAPVAMVCFVGALLTDVTYANSADIQWANFSAWLLAIGMAAGVLAAAAAVLGHVSRRTPGPVWPRAIGTLVVLALALLNNLVHSRDAWTSVVPEGLVLSVLTVVAMIGTAWLGRPSAPRPRVGSAW